MTERPRALASPAFAPGKAVKLIPEPSNRYDKYAIGVWDAALREQLGYLPREYAATIGGRSESFRTYVLRESIDKDTAKRVGVKTILAPELRMEPQR